MEKKKESEILQIVFPKCFRQCFYLLSFCCTSYPFSEEVFAPTCPYGMYLQLCGQDASGGKKTYKNKEKCKQGL